MTQVISTDRWILDWQDKSGDPHRRIVVSADSVEEVRDGLRRFLTGSTWTPEDPEEFESGEPRPAYEAFIDNELGHDIDGELRKLWSGVSFQCDDGTSFIVRER